MEILNIELSGAALALLKAYQMDHDKDHSLAYVHEEALITGLKAQRRSKDYSKATKNRKNFEAAIAANPSVVLDGVAMLKLMKKYGIGASNEQIDKLAEEAEAKALEALTKPEPAAAAAVVTETKPAA